MGLGRKVFRPYWGCLMSLDGNMFADDLLEVEGDIEQEVEFLGVDYDAVVEDKGRSQEYVMPGHKAKRRVLVLLRFSLFLEELPDVGGVLGFEGVSYRITGAKDSACGSVCEFDCEEIDA